MAFFPVPPNKLFWVEKYWIKYYGRKDLNEGLLVNMTDGGDGNNNFSEEVRQKIGNASRGRITSEETKIKIGNASRGHIVSDESRKK